MKARTYLEQIAKWDAMIRNKFIEKEQWLEVATGIVAYSDGDRVQSSGSQQRMADAADRCIDIDRQIDELKEKKAAVIATIELLPLDEYDLLHKVYVQHMDLQTAADAKRRSYSWATTIQGRAFQSVQKILDERKS